MSTKKLSGITRHLQTTNKTVVTCVLCAYKCEYTSELFLAQIFSPIKLMLRARCTHIYYQLAQFISVHLVGFVLVPRTTQARLKLSRLQHVVILNDSYLFNKFIYLFIYLINMQ